MPRRLAITHIFICFFVILRSICIILSFYVILSRYVKWTKNVIKSDWIAVEGIAMALFYLPSMKGTQIIGFTICVSPTHLMDHRWTDLLSVARSLPASRIYLKKCFGFPTALFHA